MGQKIWETDRNSFLTLNMASTINCHDNYCHSINLCRHLYTKVYTRMLEIDIKFHIHPYVSMAFTTSIFSTVLRVILYVKLYPKGSRNIWNTSSNSYSHKCNCYRVDSNETHVSLTTFCEELVHYFNTVHSMQHIIGYCILLKNQVPAHSLHIEYTHDIPSHTFGWLIAINRK